MKHNRGEVATPTYSVFMPANMRPTKLPIFLLALDGLGTLLLVFGLLGMVGMDIGLPVLTTIWPIMIILGVGLMAPFIVWAVRRALEARKTGR